MYGRFLLLSVAFSALVGCTLDFEEFRPFTPEGRQGKDMMVEPDVPNMPDVLPDVPDMMPDVPDMMPLDTDEDGVLDGVDNCVEVPNADQLNTDMADDGGDACDDDDDDDEVLDSVDNCVLVPNPEQGDIDGNGVGNACDDDDDGDGLTDEEELAGTTSPELPDTDFDGFLDGVDTCPTRADSVGLDQDMDGAGDACDQDDDGDGLPDWRDPCPGHNDPGGDPTACAPDADGDQINDGEDNCPQRANPDQAVDPCSSRFVTLTYTRAVTAITSSIRQAEVATRGGAVTIGQAAPIRLTNAQGLSANDLRSISVDNRDNRWFVTAAGLSVVRSDGFVFNLHGDDLEGAPAGALRDVEAIGERLYVSSDAGLLLQAGSEWSTVAGLPDEDVHGLWRDSLDNLWAVTQTGAARITDGVVSLTLEGLGEGFRNVTGDQESVWLLGTNGIVIVDNDGLVQPSGTFTGFDARDARVGADSLVATADGLRRIDADRRTFPPGTRPLPSADVRGVADAGQYTFVGTRGGVVSLDGYFATFGADQVGPCVTTAKRFGSLLWVGTNTGLRISQVDPESPGQTVFITPQGAEALPAVNAIEQVGNEIWVGTDGGIFVFDPNGVPQPERNIIDPIPAEDGSPDRVVTDIVNGAEGVIWVGTENGLAQFSPDGRLIGEIITSIEDAIPNNDVTALAYSRDDGTLYVATRSGIGVRTEALGFLPPIGPADLQSGDINDITVDQRWVYISTVGSTEVSNPAGSWSLLQRVNEQFPNSAGSDISRAVTAGDGYVYIAIIPTGRATNGVILRRRSVIDPDQEETAIAYFPQEVGLPSTPGAGGVRLELQNGELFVAVCGDEDSPGGLSVLSGYGLINEDHSEFGLQGDGAAASLTYGYGNEPLFTTLVGGVPVADAVGADLSLTPLELRRGSTAPPIACGVPIEEGDELWCATPGEGLTHRIDDSWGVLLREQNRQLGAGDYRDILVRTNRQLWVAAGDGVIRVKDSLPRLVNTSGTGGGLPSDDVRCLAFRDSVLYAGTAEGIGMVEIVDMDDGDSAAWMPFAPGALPNAAVTALAHDGAGRLWVGTEGGIFVLDDQGALVSSFGVAQGLPTLHINDMVILSDDRVVVATDGGVSVSDGQANFVHFGFAHGLPGVAAYQLVATPDDRVWVRSADGIGHL